ncbi:hypothetical protein DEO72_LG3g2712 [Vigna unguiculata]|uniref:Uncharacterized protein n=1 Tax=Vigna unguiculata TaxID=3917 RepID=A0A4D6LI13_VIGUN|nr:hypothetical protein DEO72_LG3g2712 [Vigna unguiculata]
MARNGTYGALAAAVVFALASICSGGSGASAVEAFSSCSRSFSGMVGYDGKDISSLVVSLRDRTMLEATMDGVTELDSGGRKESEEGFSA